MGFWSAFLGLEEADTVDAGLDDLEEDLSGQATYFEAPEGFVYDPDSNSWVAEEEVYDDGNSDFMPADEVEEGFYDDNYYYG